MSDELTYINTIFIKYLLVLKGFSYLLISCLHVLIFQFEVSVYTHMSMCIHMLLNI